ncbi:hypothetical protein K438DRAFT_2021967 [Mycena galopus ATCC 62051]|nr:hypothetical protein K438DRAFT_2021967 [Mycena galopus ATCC 62051]
MPPSPHSFIDIIDTIPSWARRRPISPYSWSFVPGYQWRLRSLPKPPAPLIGTLTALDLSGVLPCDPYPILIHSGCVTQMDGADVPRLLSFYLLAIQGVETLAAVSMEQPSIRADSPSRSSFFPAVYTAPSCPISAVSPSSSSPLSSPSSPP